MYKFLARLLLLSLILAIVGAGGAIYLLWHFGRDLPDYRQLADYAPPTMTRVHAGDGRILAEFATEKRVFVPIGAMPKRVVAAFVSAEDDAFYQHPGVDVVSIGRAVVQNLINLARDRRPVGASTITQQVAKNFLLTNELSIARKIKEAILAFRIERAFEKDRILELYLNEIYLGFGSYGVAAASLNYFNKAMSELTIAEAAFLAALPKAPANYHPIRYHAAAKARRNWVIDQMLEEGVIDAEEARWARAEPLVVRTRDATEQVEAAHFVEETRRELVERFGEQRLYTGGLSVRTTLDPRLQEAADRALRDGLVAYDRRHGWRGPLARIAPGTAWAERLHELILPPLGEWRAAVVLELAGDRALIGFADGTEGVIPLAELTWARTWREGQRIGPAVRAPVDVLAIGDVVPVVAVREDADGAAYAPGTYALRQVPEVNGALVVLDPHTGRVLAMTGGYDFEASEFNRVTQALRQPGSAFKPFVYLAALEAGMTPSTLVLDAPFVIDQGGGRGKWKPANYTRKFYGPSPMRVGVEASRNLMTVRLAQKVGMDRVASAVERFRVIDHLVPRLAMALGAGETTLLRLTTGYAMFVNGGRRITPSLIDRIQDRHGRSIFRHDGRVCERCRADYRIDRRVPAVPDGRERVAEPVHAYQIVSMLEGVIQRGTGRRVRVLGIPLGGKTGTTNDSLDAWFVGFSPDLVAGVFVGFDIPRSLGARETGSSVAAPIFKAFMEAALKGKPAIPFRVPPGTRLVRVSRQTGLPARPGDTDVILEAFVPGTVPTQAGPVLDGSLPISAPGAAVSGTGGLY